MVLFAVCLVILLINWLAVGLLGDWPLALFGGLKFLLGYVAIAVIIVVFSWGFGD